MKDPFMAALSAAALIDVLGAWGPVTALVIVPVLFGTLLMAAFEAIIQNA